MYIGIERNLQLKNSRKKINIVYGTIMWYSSQEGSKNCLAAHVFFM